MKKILVAIAVAGVMLTGCTKNQTDGFKVQNPDVIGFSTSTSRASVYDLSTLTDDPAGFKVFGQTANVSGAWYDNVDGTNNYAFASGAWGWAGEDAVWPTTDGSYPMTFYAVYPVKNLTSETVAALSDNIEIAAAAADQVDMLSAKATAGGKPASGQVSLTFKHILSKVNFGVIAGHEMRVEVQSVAVRNVNSKGTYNYITQTWSGATTSPAGYSYFFYLPANNAQLPYFETTGGSGEDTAVPIYAGTDHSNHLMLMPQSSASGAPAAWDKTIANLANGAYIEVTYLIVDTSTDPEDDYIGYRQGTTYLDEHTGFAANNNGWEPTYTGGLGTGTAQYDGFLYVKVGFPLTLNWEAGKGYTYNICLGTANSTNGYYISDNYIDDDGNETNVPILDPKGDPIEPGEPVTDGIINFLVAVDPWTDTPPTNLQ